MSTTIHVHDPAAAQAQAAEEAIRFERCWFDQQSYGVALRSLYGFRKLAFADVDQPQRLRQNCINCGAPGEAVCSYCGTQGGAR